MHNLFRILTLLPVLSGMLLGTACWPDDAVDSPPTLQQQLVGRWALTDLDAAITVDGEELAVYLGRKADAYGLAPEEVAVAVLLAEGQVVQNLIGSEPLMTLSADQSFEYQQTDEEPILGTWELSLDEQQLHLLPSTDSMLVFILQAFGEDGMTLLMDETFPVDQFLPGFTEQVRTQLTMEWERRVE